MSDIIIGIHVDITVKSCPVFLFIMHMLVKFLQMFDTACVFQNSALRVLDKALAVVLHVYLLHYMQQKGGCLVSTNLSDIM